MNVWMKNMNVGERNECGWNIECEEIYECDERRWMWWDLYTKWVKKIMSEKICQL